MSLTTPSDQTTKRPADPLAQRGTIESVLRSLRTLLEDDEKEQQETFDYLKRALDQDRPSNRRLFP
jgi:hypothetical protein